MIRHSLLNRVVVALVAASAIFVVPVDAFAGQTNVDGYSWIRTSGTGKVEATPDVALVSMGVETSATTAGAAQTANADTARQVVNAFTTAGVAQDDIRTSGFSLAPEYTFDPATNQSIFTGYRAFHGLSVLLRDLENAGADLDEAVTAGGNAARVYGVGFHLEDDTWPRVDARKAAVADARARAEDYAEEVGAQLGEVLSIDEQLGTPGAQAIPYPSSAAPGPTQFHPASVEIVERVEIVWRLQPNPVQTRSH